MQRRLISSPYYSFVFPLHLISPFLRFSSTTAATTDDEKLGGPERGPPPIRVGFTEVAGRGVFATRRIGAGELIHTARPLVSHPSLNNISSVCYFCLRRLRQPRDDPQSPTAVFCSEECREESSKAFYSVEGKMDWSEYHDYCRNQGLKYPLLLRRLACMVISGAAPADCLEILQPTSLTAELMFKMEEQYELLMKPFRAASISVRELKCIFLNCYCRLRYSMDIEQASHRNMWTQNTFNTHSLHLRKADE